MYNGKTVLAVIPARGGSKGIPRKNIKMLCGKPLIAWTIEEAQKSKYIDRLILSSEDAEIIDVAKQWGCEVPFVRPIELALDTTPGVEPVLHAMEMCPGYDYIVLLQATSPLRIVGDIDAAIQKCIDRAANTCVAVTPTKHNPTFMFSRNEFDLLTPASSVAIETTRRQDMEQLYVLNGAIYISETKFLATKKRFLNSDSLAFEMSAEKSVDIDSDFDFNLATYLLQNIQKSINNPS